MSIKLTMAAARARAGMTQEQVAEELRVTRETYARWEKDNSNTPTEAMIKFCKIVKCPFDLIHCGDQIAFSELIRTKSDAKSDA